MTTQPEKDPKMGVWTPAYARWSIQTKTDEEFENEFKCSKQKAAKHCGMKQDEVKLVLSPITPQDNREVSATKTQIESYEEKITHLNGIIQDRNAEIMDLKNKIASLPQLELAKDPEPKEEEKPETQEETEKSDPVEQPKPAAKKAAKKTAKKAAKTNVKETK